MTQDLLRSPSRSTSSADPWARLSRVTGGLGLAAFVLTFTPIIAVSTLGEPPFTATTEQAYAFLSRTGAGWAEVAAALVVLAALTLVWFVAGLSLLLARAEGSPPWRAVAGLISGVLLPAYMVLDVSWDAAGHRAADIEPGLAAYAFDVGNLGFANAWVAMGSFAVASGWIVLGTRVLGRWLGWLALVAGVGLVLARFVWTSQLWLAPYFLFWIWVIIVSVQLIRGRVRSGGQA